MTWRMIQADDNIPTITITVEEYMHLRECEAECNINTPVDKSEVLDKIKNEIADELQIMDICNAKKSNGIIVQSESTGRRVVSYDSVMNILDKYKAESEG